MVNLAIRAFRKDASSHVSVRMRDGFLIDLDLRSALQAYAYFSGEYDTAAIRDLSALIEPGWVVVDAGASIGFYTIPLARRCAAVKAVLIAVEPLPANFEALRYNLAANNVEDATIALNVALGREKGNANLVLREDFVAGAVTGNASVEIADGQDAAFQMIRITVDTLDSVLAGNRCSRLDLIRADIEGGEEDLLKGGLSVIERTKPLIYGEFNEWFLNRRGSSWSQIRSMLASLGYSCFVRHRRRWVPFVKSATESDVLCVPSERMRFVEERLTLQRS